jgi:MFS transporter, DHA2 family, multidrug resistance protein
MSATGQAQVVLRTAPAMAIVHLSTRYKAVAFGLMCLGCFLAYLDVQVVSASVQEIGGALSASQDELGWIQSSYLIAEIIVIPLSAWLSRVMSTRWLIATSAAGFTAASVLCSIAWDIDSMIAFRALQGLFGGSLIPTAFTAAVILFEDKQKAVAASFVSATAGLAPALGPVVGGWITDMLSWHWLFYVNIVPGTLIALIVPTLVRIDAAEPTVLRRADYLGMVLMAVCLGCLDYVLQEGTRRDWFGDNAITICAAISALTAIGFIARSLTHAHPVVDLRALTSRNFCLGCWFSFVTGIGIFGLIYLTPLFLGRVRGFVAWQIGAAILSAGLFQLAAIPVYTIFANRLDLRWLLALGLLSFGVSMCLFAPITNQWGWEEMLWPLAFRGLATPFVMASTVTLALGGLPLERVKPASGLYALMRSLGGAVGIAVCGIVLNDRTNLHFLRMAEHLNLASTELNNWLQAVVARYVQGWGDATVAQTAALKKLWLISYREAQVQAFADAYLVIALCFTVSLVMVPLLRKVTVADRQPRAVTAHRCVP